MIDLSGRVVIVTSATAASGSAVAELEALGATAIGVQCDVSDEDTVPAPCGRRSLHDLETVGAFLADPSLIFHTGTARS